MMDLKLATISILLTKCVSTRIGVWNTNGGKE